MSRNPDTLLPLGVARLLDHVRFDAEHYLELKAAGDLTAVQARWNPSC